MISKEVLHRLQSVPEVTAIPLPERVRSQAVRERLVADHYDAQQIIAENSDILSQLPDTPFRAIGQKLVKGETLAFAEAFLGMTFVVGATNKVLFGHLKPSFSRAHGLVDMRQEQLSGPAQTLLTAMAQREAHATLTPEEVAGMVAAAMMDINLRLEFSPYVLETGGMGGDKGFVVNGEKRKVINASTLSSIVLTSMNIPVVKHGSYANTSAVGSTEVIEALGVNIYQASFNQIKRLFDETNFYFSDAHVAKTIHDLSHSPFMRHETINHIIGPMTAPVDRNTTLHKVIGVNEGAHPSLIARAYELLHQKGHQRVGNVLVVSGFSADTPENIDFTDPMAARPYMMLDEVSPHKTLLGVVRSGIYAGCFIVKPDDFGATVDPARIQVVNTQKELLAANEEALMGLNSTNTDYLAMNAAVGLFAVEYLDMKDAIIGNRLNTNYLKECFERCKKAIVSGMAGRHLKKIVRVSRGETYEQD